MRIGLLGGSFDPVHRAHIELAKAARDALDLDEVQLLPASAPWQKPALSATAADRLAMLELATASHAKLSVNPMELNRAGKTYTIDTLKALPAQHNYFWIMGADQLQNFPSWHCWQEIAQRVTLLAAQRPGAELAIPAELQALVDGGHAAVQTLDFVPMDISATTLRHNLAAGEPVDQWIDAKVAAYIAKHGLYQTDSSSERPLESPR